MTLSANLRRCMGMLLFALIAGCGAHSSAVSYYSLDAMAAGPQVSTADLKGPAIGIAEVMLPDYLDRPQLVWRTGENRMNVDEYHRWAGQLQDEISRVLLENLRTLGPSPRIERAPWPTGFRPDIIVTLQLNNFEAFPDGMVRLTGSVTLADLRPSAQPIVWNVRLQEAAARRSPSAYVAAQSRLLATLSRQIGDAIGRRPQP